MMMIYKICPAQIWQQAEKTGFFDGAGIDLVDGYIHFSNADQLAETARLHFAGQADHVLVEVDAVAINIVWEESRGGQLFPHLYDRLPLSAVVSVWPLGSTTEGMHQLPPHPLTV